MKAQIKNGVMKNNKGKVIAYQVLGATKADDNLAKVTIGSRGKTESTLAVVIRTPTASEKSMKWIEKKRRGGYKAVYFFGPRSAVRLIKSFIKQLRKTNPQLWRKL